MAYNATELIVTLESTSEVWNSLGVTNFSLDLGAFGSYLATSVVKPNNYTYIGRFPKSEWLNMPKTLTLTISNTLSGASLTRTVEKEQQQLS